MRLRLTKTNTVLAGVVDRIVNKLKEMACFYSMYGPAANQGHSNPEPPQRASAWRYAVFMSSGCTTEATHHKAQR